MYEFTQEELDALQALIQSERYRGAVLEKLLGMVAENVARGCSDSDARFLIQEVIGNDVTELASFTLSKLPSAHRRISYGACYGDRVTVIFEECSASDVVRALYHFAPERTPVAVKKLQARGVQR